MPTEGLTEARTRRVFLGTMTLTCARVIGASSSIILTGLTGRYLSRAEFGLWAILTALPAFVTCLDLGLGNALRNKLAGLSLHEHLDAHCRSYFFSIFKVFLYLTLGVAVCLVVLNPWILWTRLITSSASIPQPGWTAACLVAIVALAIQLPFSLSNFGLYAYQETHWSAFLEALRSAVLCVVTGAALFYKASFFAIVLAYFATWVLSTGLIWTVFLRRRAWRWEWPRWPEVHQALLDMGGASFQFAVLQLAAGVILYTDALLVNRVAGLGQAGDYAVVQKLFSYVIAAEFFMLIPLWSAYTQADARQDIHWVRTNLRRTEILSALFLAGGSLLLMTLGPWVVKLWTGKTILHRELFMAMAVWTVCYGISNCYSVYLNGVGRLRRQASLAVFGALYNVPLALWFGKLWGPVGVCWAGVLSIIPATISNPIEAYRYISGKEAAREPVNPSVPISASSLPLVSILIPTYNRVQHLRETLDSVLAQDYPHLEIIVSDNASTDETSQIRHLYSRDKRIQWHTNPENIGLDANWRKLLYEYASGEIAKILPDDDYLLDPKHISRAVELMTREKLNTVFSQSATLKAAGQLEVIDWNLPPVLSPQDWMRCLGQRRKGHGLLPNFATGAVFNLQKAKDYQAFIDPVFGMDYQLAMQFILAGKTGYLTPVQCVDRQDGTNDGLNSPLEVVLTGLKLFERTYFFGQSLQLPEKTLRLFCRKMIIVFIRSLVLRAWVREKGASWESFITFYRTLWKTDPVVARKIIFHPGTIAQFLLGRRPDRYERLKSLYHRCLCSMESLTDLFTTEKK